MHKKIFLFGLLGLTLALGSCRKGQDVEPLAPRAEQTESLTASDDEYVEVGLRLGGDQGLQTEELRAVTYSLGSNLLPTFVFGNDGDKVKVRTQIYTATLGGEGQVIERKSLFYEVLDWTVTNNGRRLVYDKRLLIRKADLEGVPAAGEFIALSAFLIRFDTQKVGYRGASGPDYFPPVPLWHMLPGVAQTIGKKDIPFAIRNATLRYNKVGANHELVLENEKAFVPKFRPEGQMAFFSIRNTTNVQQTFGGISFNGLQYRHDYAYDESRRRQLNIAPQVSDEKLNELRVELEAGQTMYFALWRGQLTQTLSGTFDPLRHVTYNYTRGNDGRPVKYVHRGLPSAKGLSWHVDIVYDDETSLDNITADGVDFGE